MLAPPVARSTKTENSDFLSVMKIPRLSWKIVWNNISVPQNRIFFEVSQIVIRKTTEYFYQVGKESLF